jgi:DNA-directed RNA polymerase subunit RPC12/RpoP
MNLKIQCPKCSKKFTVYEDLTGKTVECGACDHRFPVKEESIAVERSKVYPGEHNKRDDEFLSRLGRDPSTPVPANQGRPPLGAPTPQVDAIMPASAGQNIAVGAGVSFLFLYALIFFVGSSDGGTFQDVAKIQRYILGGFVVFISGGLIMFGAKNWRGRAFLLALLLGGALFALILVRPVHLTPEAVVFANPELEVEQPEVPEPTGVSRDRLELKARVGYQAIERKLLALEDEFEDSAPQHLVGIFIEDLSSNQFHNLEKYFQIELKIPPTEAISRYPRNGEKDSLIVISGFKLDLDAVVRICDPRLGRATTYPELRLIDLKLSALHDSKHTEDLRNKLSNPEHPSFFKENLNELRALDPLRRKDAVTKLAEIPDGVERRFDEEIVTELIRLTRTETDPQLLADMGRALTTWARENSVAVDVVTEKVEAWVKSNARVPASFIDYLVKANGEQAPFLIDTLWSKEPEVWASQYISLGVPAEKRMIFHLDGPSIRLRKAAAFVLASIGTERALPSLSKYQNASDNELKVLVERAMAAIKSR